MWLNLLRTLVVAALGAWAGWRYDPMPGQPWLGVALGVAAALTIITLESRLHRVPAHNMVGALVGGETGLLGASLVWGVIQGLDLVAEHFIHSVVIVFLIYIWVVIGTRRGEGSSRRASSPRSRTPRVCTSTRCSTRPWSSTAASQMSARPGFSMGSSSFRPS